MTASAPCTGPSHPSSTGRTGAGPLWPGLAVVALCGALGGAGARAEGPGAGEPPPGAAAAPPASAVAAAAASSLPDGFLEVELGSKPEEVKRALTKGAQIYEVNDVKNCPTAPAQPCRQLIEQVQKGSQAPHKKATYVFNPFTGNLARILVDYRIDYLEVARGFSAQWGPPTEEREVEVPAQAFFPRGSEYTKEWRNEAVEIVLVHRVFPTSPNQSTEGHVEFVSLAEAALEAQMAERLHTLDAPKARSDSKEPGTAESGSPAKLF